MVGGAPVYGFYLLPWPSREWRLFPSLQFPMMAYYCDWEVHASPHFSNKLLTWKYDQLQIWGDQLEYRVSTKIKFEQPLIWGERMGSWIVQVNNYILRERR